MSGHWGTHASKVLFLLHYERDASNVSGYQGIRVGRVSVGVSAYAVGHAVARAKTAMEC